MPIQTEQDRSHTGNIAEYVKFLRADKTTKQYPLPKCKAGATPAGRGRNRAVNGSDRCQSCSRSAGL
jgi:hypothetical protein